MAPPARPMAAAPARLERGRRVPAEKRRHPFARSRSDADRCWRRRGSRRPPAGRTRHSNQTPSVPARTYQNSSPIVAVRTATAGARRQLEEWSSMAPSCGVRARRPRRIAHGDHFGLAARTSRRRGSGDGTVEGEDIGAIRLSELQKPGDRRPGVAVFDRADVGRGESGALRHLTHGQP